MLWEVLETLFQIAVLFWIYKQAGWQVTLYSDRDWET